VSIRVRVFADIAIREARRASTPGRARIAEAAAADAVSSAPVDSGEYRSGMHASVNGDRVAVASDDPESIVKEFGTSDTPAHATVTNAVRKHGRYRGLQPKRG
jgi:hypothetical protein